VLDELPDPILDGRTAPMPLWMRPLPAHKFSMPPQQRLRRHDQPASASRRKHTNECREEDTVRLPQRRATHPPAQHHELMPQHEQLNTRTS
jgi:hypothetical protein